MAYHTQTMTALDSRAVIDIANYFIRTSFAAYPQKELSYEHFGNLMQRIASYPALTLRDDMDQVVGFGHLSPYHATATFAHTAEITYFILPSHTRKGLGRRLLDELIDLAQERGITTLVANVSSLNQPSLDFHLQNGFRECGRLTRIGRKFGEFFDVVWLQRDL